MFELPHGSYFVLDIQDYFKYIPEKHETVTDNLSIMIYVNKIENRITFKIKSGYYLELLTPETMKFFGSTKSTITTHLACDVVETSHLGLILVETLRIMLRRHHDVATGT